MVPGDEETSSSPLDKLTWRLERCRSMSTAKLMLKSPNSQHWEGQAEREFSTLPRTGDLIEIEGNDMTLLYRVVTVIHSQEKKSAAVQIYAVYVGQTAEVMEMLFKDINVAKSMSEIGGAPIGFTSTTR